MIDRGKGIKDGEGRRGRIQIYCHDTGAFTDTLELNLAWGWTELTDPTNKGSRSCSGRWSTPPPVSLDTYRLRIFARHKTPEVENMSISLSHRIRKSSRIPAGLHRPSRQCARDPATRHVCKCNSKQAGYRNHYKCHRVGVCNSLNASDTLREWTAPEHHDGLHPTLSFLQKPDDRCNQSSGFQLCPLGVIPVLK